jgi:hypothetical protein
VHVQAVYDLYAQAASRQQVHEVSFYKASPFIGRRTPWQWHCPPCQGTSAPDCTISPL